VGVVSISAVLLWVGTFGVFLEGFMWLEKFGGEYPDGALRIGDIVLVRMLSVFAMALFFMLIFSNVLIGFSTLYRSREVACLLQSPISYRGLFLVRFAECVIYSSWASAYLGSPLILAYGLTTGAPLWFYVAAAVFYLPFVVVPAAIGLLITLLLVRVFPRLRLGSMIGAGIIALALFFVYLRVRLSPTRLSEDVLLATLLDAAGRTQSPFLPSYWAAHGVLAAATRNYRDCLFHFLLLSSNALLLTWAAAEAAERLFYPGWSLLTGQDRTRLRPMGRGILGRVDLLLARLRNPARALAVKDIRLFWREPTQWSQFVIFFGLMAVYIATLKNSSYVYQSEFWRSWVACLNIAACTLILATLTSRFVFPLISLEGRRFWLLGLAPISFRQLMWQKFRLSVATTAAFTVAVVVLSSIVLEAPPVHFFLAVYSIGIANFGLVGLAVGLGSLYPNFREDNPARIVSGLGGTLNFLLSMAYIGLIVGAQALILQWRVLGAYTRPEGFWWALAIVMAFITSLSIGASVVPMRLGLAHLKTVEF
jgi:ABC-2 type transport system permease protein